MYESKKVPVLQVQEQYGTTVSNLYQLSNSDEKVFVKHLKELDERWQSFSTFFTTVFLPHGYPDSVSKDYLQYQIWDSFQAFASSITGSICTHAILKGAGVGDENASPLAATITWIIKDGTSLVGRIVFAWLQGTKLDCDCKKWRLFADVMNDLAMLLDLLSAYFQNHFMLIICVSGLFKSLVGVAGASTRAALTQHQARRNNMADVSAKDSSQETLVNLLALICSLILIPVVTKSLLFTWITYVCMTVVHLFANYNAVKSVSMETFNIARFKILATHYFVKGMTQRHFLSVEDVNKKENVFFSLKSEKFDVKLGSSFKDIIGGKRYSEIEALLQLYKDCDYLLSLSRKSASKIILHIALSRKATVLTQMEALYQACFLIHMIKISDAHLNAADNHLYYESSSRNYTAQTFFNFLNNVKSNGFNTNAAFFDVDMWKLDW